ncbi:MAG: DUF1553 domain-containing protein [Verrucomicrobiae bacterium]|nr:DUF1553 domain-containing protein [Verrucomicrobiae bacterium]
MNWFRIIPLLAVAVWSSRGDDFSLFEKSIRPALIEHCQECHGESKQKGGLRLDSRAGWMSGGDSGPAIVPGEPEKSLLFDAISYRNVDTEMPPKGKLPAPVIAAFEDWIRQGAPDPRAGGVVVAREKTPSVEEGREFWSFQPLKNDPPPLVRDTKWPRDDIDRHILRGLEAAGFEPAPSARPGALIRRLYYDLTGLPPTSEQLAEAEGSWSDARYAALVDELLASPAFGERWGRHWLDVVRFAESSGGGRTLLFPEAWRYRDYVIDAFNNDLPYDQFTREQIAGDLLPSEDWREQRRRITATAFLVLGPTNYELQDKDVLEMDIIDEQLDTIGRAFMGMTIGCARCHDHKFDPIPTRDYYAMAGIFKSTKSVVHSNVSKWSEASLPLPPEEEEAFRIETGKIAEMKTELVRLKAEGARLGLKTGAPAKSAKSIDPDSLPGIVVDDTEASLEGSWVSSASTRGFVGAGYIHDASDGKGAKFATFKPALAHAGLYEVQFAWPAFSNRAEAVPVTVHHGDGATLVMVDESESPPIEGHRVSLGQFRFPADGSARVVVSNENTDDGVVVADAVLFIPVRIEVAGNIPPLPKAEDVDNPELIPFVVPDPSRLEGLVIDDTEAELIGEWRGSVHTPPFVGAGYIHDGKEGKGEKSVIFRPDLKRAGNYEVRVSHNTNIRRSTNAPVTIRHAGGETSVRINEGEEAPINRLFRSLGEFPFEAGTNGSVVFGTEGTDGKYVIVDAVQFIFRPLKREQLARLGEVEKQIKALEKEMTKLERALPRRPVAMAVEEGDTMGDIPLAIRGVVRNRGPITPRGVLSVATLGTAPAIPEDASGRREFVDWLASDHHPLTARVMVNRVWHWLFGRGIVSTVDNFGTKGAAPSHPELLDHLASGFIADGWSTKRLVRRLVLSAAYRCAAEAGESLESGDPDNRLFGRMRRKRLDAEAIRDTLLFISARMDDSQGGSNIKAGTKIEYGYRFESLRRSVYVPVFRNTLPEIFGTFDFADPNIQLGRRNTSTIAPQALLLMNSPFVIECARAAAKRLLERSELSASERVRRAYRQTLGREPDAGETAASLRFVQVGEPADRWALLYQTLFATIDFRYLD